MKHVLLLVGMLTTVLSSQIVADEDRPRRWAVSIWGLSYHIDDDVDFDQANVGVGLRYYVSRRTFAEVDALRNSNSGLAVPISAGMEFRMASFGHSCGVYAVAAGSVVYYENQRTGVNYVKAGPVPGVTVGCGRLKANTIVVLRGNRQPVAAIAASLTIHLR